VNDDESNFANGKTHVFADLASFAKMIVGS